MNYQITGSNNCYLTVNNIEFWLGAVAPKYDVTVSDAIVGGSVTASKAKAKEGEKVTLVPIANAGYDFTAWDVTCVGNPVSVSENKFTMPAGDVTVSATFTAKPTYSITLTQPVVGGTISIPVVATAYGVKLYHAKDSSYNCRYYSISFTAE